jgi:hypothetical protein
MFPARRALSTRRRITERVWACQIAAGKIENRIDLFPRQPVVQLNQFVDSNAVIQILQHNRDGLRVSLNTHAPLTFPGTLSTAGHCDQSSCFIKSSTLL